MGLGTRIFIVEKDDSLQRLTLKGYNRLIKGHPDEGLIQYAGKRIRYALIVLEMINRKPAEVLMIEYLIISRMHVNIHEILVKFCYWQGVPCLVGTKISRYPEKMWMSIDCAGHPLI